jgi:hypothetical protein
LKKIFTSAIVILLLLAIYYAYSHAKNQEQPFKFQPDGCELYVYFPKRPVITEITAETTTGQRIIITRAELIFLDAGYFIRAEFTPKLPNSLNFSSDKSLTDGAIDYTKNDGWTAPTVLVENTKIGKMVSIRGYKTLQGIPITFENKIFYGEKSVMSLYSGGPSKTYPGSFVVPFFRSIDR